MYLCFYDQPIIEYIHCHLVSYAVCMFTLVMASLGSLLFRTTCVIALFAPLHIMLTLKNSTYQ